AEMPARTRQPLQRGLGRGLLVEMHRLRVVFARKLEDILARDMARAEGAEAADRKIFESEGHSVRDCRREGQIVAALCGNLNPSACMASTLRAFGRNLRPIRWGKVMPCFHDNGNDRGRASFVGAQS